MTAILPRNGKIVQAMKAVWEKRWDKTALTLEENARMIEYAVGLGRARN